MTAALLAITGAPIHSRQDPLAKRRRATKRLTLPQASNMMAAVTFAREIGTPLNAMPRFIGSAPKQAMTPMVSASPRFVKDWTNGSSAKAFLGA
jgi:hypothetical protein